MTNNMTKFQPLLEKTFTQPDVVPSLFHEKRQEILSILIDKEMTVYELKNTLNMNPGVVKRHIDNLLQHGLIKQTHQEQNRMGMTLKYYRAVATKFIVKLEWKKEVQ